jgi:membrane protein implicated in regulation of membrane protease activity
VVTLLLIGGAGVLLLLVSLVVGDVLDGAFDVGSDLFSGSALAGFLGAFGFAGALALDATDSMGVAIGVGLASGLVIGGGVGYLTSRLQRGGDEANVRTGDLVGRDATVVSTIPVEGFGEVSMVASGHITKLNARAPGGLSAGTPVRITAVLSATSVAVEPRT